MAESLELLKLATEHNLPQIAKLASSWTPPSPRALGINRKYPGETKTQAILSYLKYACSDDRSDETESHIADLLHFWRIGKEAVEIDTAVYTQKQASQPQQPDAIFSLRNPEEVAVAADYVVKNASSLPRSLSVDLASALLRDHSNNTGVQKNMVAIEKIAGYALPAEDVVRQLRLRVKERPHASAAGSLTKLAEMYADGHMLTGLALLDAVDICQKFDKFENVKTAAIRPAAETLMAITPSQVAAAAKDRVIMSNGWVTTKTAISKLTDDDFGDWEFAAQCLGSNFLVDPIKVAEAIRTCSRQDADRLKDILDAKGLGPAEQNAEKMAELARAKEEWLDDLVLAQDS